VPVVVDQVIPVARIRSPIPVPPSGAMHSVIHSASSAIMDWPMDDSFTAGESPSWAAQPRDRIGIAYRVGRLVSQLGVLITGLRMRTVRALRSTGAALRGVAVGRRPG
jgi:hypothetical protein